MKAVTFTYVPSPKSNRNLSLMVDGVELGDKPHVFPDEVAAQIRQSPLAPQIASVEDIEPRLRKYDGRDLGGKTLLMWRTGGYGDILFITPLIRHLARRFPRARIHFGTRLPYHAVLRGNPDVRRIYPMPMPLTAVDEADFHLHFENTIEKSTDTRTHAVDLFAAHAGVELREDEKVPVYRLDATRANFRLREMIEAGIPPDVPWIAVQPRASSPIRTYPPHLFAKLVKKLVQGGFAVVALGGKGDFPASERRSGIFDLTGRYPDMADSVAALASCDVLVAPDSSLVHFAGALEIPTVALYGPFPGNVRTKYYRNCVTLEADAPCAPCFLHGYKPCAAAARKNLKWSPCFETLPPSMIVDAVKQALTRWGVKRRSAVAASASPGPHAAGVGRSAASYLPSH